MSSNEADRVTPPLPRAPPVMRGATSFGVDVPPMITDLSTNTWSALFQETQPVTRMVAGDDVSEQPPANTSYYFANEDNEGDILQRITIESEIGRYYPNDEGGVQPMSEMSALLAERSVHNSQEMKQSPEGIYHRTPADVLPVNQMADFPSNTAYAGVYDMSLSFPSAPEHESKKTISYRYLNDVNKLFVRQRVHCPIVVHVNTQTMPCDALIRATIVFDKAAYIQQVVTRCKNHIAEDDGKMDSHHHFVRCHSRDAVYETNGVCNRESVIAQWQTNQSQMAMLYEFMCFSSCSTISRRAMTLVVTLEHGNEVIGRCCVGIKVCACPGRDAQICLDHEAALNQADDPPPEKRRKALPTPPPQSTRHTRAAPPQRVTQFTTVGENDNQVYHIEVVGRELYQLLMTIVRNHELSKRYENIVENYSGGGTGSTMTGPALESMTSTEVRRAIPDVVDDETPVHKWMASIDMQRYGEVFAKNNLLTMGQLTTENMDVDHLTGYGISRGDAPHIQASFTRWHCLSVKSPPLPQPRRDLSAMSTASSTVQHGLRYTKHTIRHTYQVVGSGRRKQILQPSSDPEDE